MGICRSTTLGKQWSHCPSPLWGSRGAIAHPQPMARVPTYGKRAAHPHKWQQPIRNTENRSPHRGGAIPPPPPYTNEGKEGVQFWSVPSRPFTTVNLSSLHSLLPFYRMYDCLNSLDLLLFTLALHTRSNLFYCVSFNLLRISFPLFFVFTLLKVSRVAYPF